ncbi:endo-1,4-beta-xylanase [Fimbriimonas ginsengisoli]|uniref:Beta-xylanase n=1 Tax=Fimbriimonas ginsengisoli Gsoil 348 TaxID=661478 RepID=A0A068NQI6_FIMGI|nr:endo-1,4-beta-xylanase [Fimbriimonas ginsengisoli]AIE85828.1 endo-1,4-beta-xylanase [Fimbriimonas ginsengisoli Gsoil 348]
MQFVLVSLVLSAGVAAISDPIELTREGPGLRDLAKKRRLPLGAAAPVFCLHDEADGGKYTSTLAREFDMVELENELKPPAVWTGPHEYRFSDVDYVLGEPGKKGWAQQHKMKLRGHVLVYASDNGYTLPQWLRSSEKDLTKEQASGLLHDYILALAGRYRGKVAMWDVANEAIDDRPNNNPFNLRDSLWFRKLGPEFLVLAFKWAHEADPKAQLYYNEYGIEGGGPKAKHILELAKWLKDQGAPITGLGLQYHIDCRTKIEPGDGHYGLIEEIRKLRLSYMITELDVAVPAKPLPASDPNRGLVANDPMDLDRQAHVYASVFRMALSSKNCRGVQLWGFTDRHSWIPGFSRGRNGAALPFDGDYNPKPAYSAIATELGR